MRLGVLTTFMALLASSLGLKVLSTDQDKARPDIDGYVEILNSSLKGYDEFTLCGRFLVYHFPRNPGQMDYQLILSVGKRYLLSSYGASPCEDLYPGCTDYFKARRYIQTLLSLVELLHYCALIDREHHSDVTPAFLCHKDLLGGVGCLELVIYGLRELASATS